MTADAREVELAVADGAWPTTRRLPRSTTVGVSTYAPLVRVRAAGVVLGAWPALVAFGVVAALVVQSLLAARRGLPVTLDFLIAALACLLRLAGAKV